ncbi:MAG: Protein translocase subunit SecA [Alphaproteobacteria bacterium MarineAlpha5_Bin5]|nr:MAG: Protein translocase subunit SecA [Alphaproteobacteria bacterium MarineAlpha5_Bin5]PPR51308.1 MAG: Protein translocase subunit SecA [Alphaproteobacteria bacterium MarineAlpha5_Bin4]|tara:strand:- start:995 stop:3511 length:2517 start_codon:yes stop_codon:yes gene_type:complete
MLNIVNKLFRSLSSNSLKKYSSTVEKINQFEKEISSLSDADIKEKTSYFKEIINQDNSLEKILPEAFAVVREAAKRTVNMRHFDVQLIGGIVLHEGRIAEMKTGEGKTIVATLAAYLNSLDGKSVHIVTVNDYLARRDAEWMGKIFNFLDLSVGCVNSQTDPSSRSKEYACDIVYATNNEIGFDYLRDNLKADYHDLCFKKDAFAIVDEVDSILIDEARTPLVISAEASSSIEIFPKINKIVKLFKDSDYEISEESKSVLLTNDGMEFAEKLLTDNGLIKKGTLQDLENMALNHNIIQGLRAHKLFIKDKDYIIKNNSIVIIDELSGRPMEGRRYGDGLHQAIEAKEGLNIQKENQTIASITYQNFFRTYKKLSGMTGTALTEATEFEGIYNLRVIEIPPNLNVNRIDKNDQIYMTKKEKYDAVIDLVKERHLKKQPILIGTTSVENSELISKLLLKNSIKHNVLNAKQHEKEAEIILQAGIPGNVTISTNMAGRGTDIKLGNENENLKKEAINSGGLLVVGTERHESRRIDNQLRGRSGRQGDIGESIFFLSLEDDLMRIFGSKTLENVLEKIGLKEGEVITHSLITKSLERAQQKVEAHNYDMRKQILKFDDILNDQRKIIYQNRKEILITKDQSKIIEEMIEDNIDNLIMQTIPPKKFKEDWDAELLNEKIREIFNLKLPIKEWFEEEGVDEEEIKKRLYDQINQKYNEQKYKYSSDLLKFAEKRVMLYQLDKDWREHLAAMDMLRGSVNLRAMGGKDPFYEYKKESFDYFDEMLSNQNERVLKTLFNLQLVNENSNLNKKPNEKEPNRIVAKKIGRNATCPCGSGKKYKLCHGV